MHTKEKLNKVTRSTALKHKAHFDWQKIAHLFFHEISTVWRVNANGTFCEGFKSGSSLVFLNVLYRSALETKGVQAWIWKQLVSCCVETVWTREVHIDPYWSGSGLSCEEPINSCCLYQWEYRDSSATRIFFKKNRMMQHRTQKL